MFWVTYEYNVQVSKYFWLTTLITSLSSFIPLLQQIQSNFVVVIHPGSRMLRIGRATDTLPVTIPHVIARRHKQSGQPRYEDAWLLREGLNVRLCLHSVQISLCHFSFALIASSPLSDRNQRVTSRGRMGWKWSTRPSGPRRCRTECGGRRCLLNRFVYYQREKREGRELLHL